MLRNIRRMTIASLKDIDLHSKQYLGYRWLLFKNNLQHCTNIINGGTIAACKTNRNLPGISFYELFSALRYGGKHCKVKMSTGQR